MLNSKWNCWLLLIVSKIRYNVMRMYSVIHTFIKMTLNCHGTDSLLFKVLFSI